MSARNNMMAAIDRKLDGLGAKFDTHSKRDEEQLSLIAERLDKFDRRFDGSDASPGLTVRIDRLERNQIDALRLDRLEQKQIERSRVFWWALGIFGAVVAAEAGVLLRVLAHLP